MYMGISISSERKYIEILELHISAIQWSMSSAASTRQIFDQPSCLGTRVFLSKEKSTCIFLQQYIFQTFLQLALIIKQFIKSPVPHTHTASTAYLPFSS